MVEKSSAFPQSLLKVTPRAYTHKRPLENRLNTQQTSSIAHSTSRTPCKAPFHRTKRHTQKVECSASRPAQKAWAQTPRPGVPGRSPRKPSRTCQTGRIYVPPCRRRRDEARRARRTDLFLDLFVWRVDRAWKTGWMEGRWTFWWKVEVEHRLDRGTAWDGVRVRPGPGRECCSEIEEFHTIRCCSFGVCEHVPDTFQQRSPSSRNIDGDDGSFSKH